MSERIFWFPAELPPDALAADIITEADGSAYALGREGVTRGRILGTRPHWFDTPDQES